jgi:hypothetical protein
MTKEKTMNAVKLPSIVVIFFCAIFMLFSLHQAQAEVPKLINYQGKLTTPEGAPLDTTVSMQFSIYSDSIGGDPLWTETQASVKVDKGIFNVLLGSVSEIPESVFTGNIRYLGVKVGDDPEMIPRKAIVSVGYAYKALDADMVDGRDASGFLRFIYQDAQYIEVTEAPGPWVTAKTTTLPPHTVTSYIVVYYDLIITTEYVGSYFARVTINGQPVDVIQQYLNANCTCPLWNFRAVRLAVDNSASVVVSIELWASHNYVANYTFLILGN